jgi:hypothetical protein
MMRGLLRGAGMASVSARKGTPLPAETVAPSVAQQRHELRCRCDLRGESRTARGLFHILAPGFDLKGFVELRSGEGLGAIEATVEQCERYDQRVAGRGRRMQCRQREVLISGDGRGGCCEARAG